MRSFLHLIGPGDLLGPILGSIPWPMLLLVFLALMGAYLLLKRMPRHKTDDVTFVRLPFLSKAEVMFLGALETSVYPEYRVFARVPLRDLILVNCENLSSQTRAQNRINFKTVDFVLVDPQRFEVHKVVELDDRTHDDVRWKDRDAFIDDVLGRAGLPIIHCKCKLFYDPASLRSQLNLPPVLLET
jgi:Protein of unknown function (DUF2726)